MSKIFIYYSHSGNGEVVADYFKDKGIEVRKVIPVKELPNKMVPSILMGGFRAAINAKDKLRDFDDDISAFDEVIIGSPIWNARLSTPINTVLSKLKLDDKKVSFVFCSASGTSPKATEKVSGLYPNAKIIDLKEPKANKEELAKLDVF